MDNNTQIEEFAQTIFNYFQNDYLMIKDFLQKETPWNEMICLMLKKNNDELFQLKTDFLSKMIFTYQYNIIYPIQFSNNKENVTCVPDKLIYRETLNIRKYLNEENIYSEDNFIGIFTEYVVSNDFAFLQIIKHYMHTLSTKGYKLEENHYNAFKYDIRNIYEIYSRLEYSTGFIYVNDAAFENNMKQYKEVSDKFYISLYKEVRRYIDGSFRTNYEKKMFIKYLISLAYADLKGLDDLSEEDESIIDILENAEDITAIMLEYKDLFCLVLEIVHSLYVDFGEYYDIRNTIEDENNFIPSLDKTFKKNSKNIYKMDSIYTELYLEDVLESFDEDNMSNDEILCYLIRKDLSIYDRLFYSNLDPRFELDYKKDLIRKIIADNYEYHCYLTNYLEKEIENNHYINLNNIDVTKFDELIKYFVDNYQSLIDNYYNYQNESTYVSEKARLQMCKSGDLTRLININRYSLNRFWLIFSKNIVELSSVDYMNKCIRAIETNYENYEYDDVVKMISSMCLNIYEKLLLGQIEGNATPYIKNYIENTEDIAEHLIDDSKIRKLLEKLFIEINEYNISYSEEVNNRKKIDDSHQKILKKLNPFEE